MIRCLAIDDEPLALQQLAAYIKKVPFLELAGQCRSALDAKAILESDVIDAIFVDINMPDLNGMDFVRSLVAPPLVVFTTAYSEYAIEGFKVDALDYLLKPFGMDDFMRAANKVKKQYELLNSKELPQEDGAIFVKSDYKTIRLDKSAIRYVEGMGEYLRFYLVDRDKPVIALLAMKKLEDHLPTSTFMRIHRSYIVNLTRIKEVNKSRVIMDDDTDVPIGDIYREAFNRYLEAKFLSK